MPCGTKRIKTLLNEISQYSKYVQYIKIFRKNFFVFANQLKIIYILFLFITFGISELSLDGQYMESTQNFQEQQL